MTITYADGKTVEAFILSRTEETMRVAVKDDFDAKLFTCIEGAWISECGELVEIDFEGWRQTYGGQVFEDDWICPNEVAVRLMDCLFGGSEGEWDANRSSKRQQTLQDWKHVPLQTGHSKASRLPN